MAVVACDRCVVEEDKCLCGGDTRLLNYNVHGFAVTWDFLLHVILGLFLSSCWLVRPVLQVYGEELVRVGSLEIGQAALVGIEPRRGRWMWRRQRENQRRAWGGGGWMQM